MDGSHDVYHLGRHVRVHAVDKVKQGRVMMNAVENIFLIAFLMACGVSATVAMLAGFVYYLEVQDE